MTAATPKRPAVRHPKGWLRMLFKTTLPLRFWSKIYADPSGCWQWIASLTGRGYGVFRVGSRRAHAAAPRHLSYAHRLSYESLVSPIAGALTIDHLCRNRGCVNPAHMEPVTIGENILRGNGSSAVRARQTHCLRGHPFDSLNTHIRQDGTRHCRACDRDRCRRYYERKIDAAAELSGGDSV